MAESPQEKRQVTGLLVECYEFIDDGYPPWVKARLIDADGETLQLAFKTPMLLEDDEPTESTPMPIMGRVRCEVLASEIDVHGRETVVVLTTHVETIEDDIREFRVRPDQLTDWPTDW